MGGGDPGLIDIDVEILNGYRTHPDDLEVVEDTTSPRQAFISRRTSDYDTIEREKEREIDRRR